MYHLANSVHYYICIDCRAFFLFSFSWSKVLSARVQSPTSLCNMLLVDVGMPSYITCKKEICSLPVSRFIFSALFSSSNSLVTPIHFPLPSQAFSCIHCTNLFSFILFYFIFFLLFAYLFFFYF